MSSKKYRNRECAYGCERMAATADHVFAREFFVPSAKYEPIKVPACSQCNGQKSQLEHYLTAVLPFGGRHQDSTENLTTMVPKRLERNAKLQRAISTGASRIWVPENGILLRSMSLPLNFQKVEQLFCFVAKGLAYYHWGVTLKSHHFVTPLALTTAGEQKFRETFFNRGVASAINSDLANKTFVYEGVQGTDNPHITAWLISVYGGIALGGDPRDPALQTSIMGVITGPISAINDPAFRARLMPT